MSGAGQTAARAGAYVKVEPRGPRRLELLLYGLDENGEPAFSERLEPHHRTRLREHAARRLERFHAVEVWDGPTCVLRLRRPHATG
jgi:hypothetical protein